MVPGRISILLVYLGISGVAGSLAAQSRNFIENYQAPVSAAQAEQPRWVTPLVTVTLRLEQEFHADFVHQCDPKRFAI
jgi:hypothetical protein